MQYLRIIVERFGGVRACGRALGKHHNTVQSWLERGAIRDEHKVDLIHAAQRHGIALSWDDFKPPEIEANTPEATPKAAR